MSKFFFKSFLPNTDNSPEEIQINHIDKMETNEIEGSVEEDTVVEELKQDISIPHIDYPIIESEETIKIKSLPDINEAQERNERNDPSCSIITTACGPDGSDHVCFYKENCPILNAYDKMIYERLEQNEVIAIEVRWCHKYKPKYNFR